jgi:hypothetical protein
MIHWLASLVVEVHPEMRLVRIYVRLVGGSEEVEVACLHSDPSRFEILEKL